MKRRQFDGITTGISVNSPHFLIKTLKLASSGDALLPLIRSNMHNIEEASAIL